MRGLCLPPAIRWRALAPATEASYFVGCRPGNRVVMSCVPAVPWVHQSMQENPNRIAAGNFPESPSETPPARVD